ncbi:hypothetical protein ACHAQA_001208 [Verticillium albo-atrum]
MSKYCEACFSASNHTINLVQQAYESKYLPQRNPFVLYFLFAASLIVLSNEFGAIYANPSYESSINNSIVIMKYCAGSDPQANRLLYILNSFKSAIAHVRATDMDAPALASPLPVDGTQDPMMGIFSPSKGSRKSSFVVQVSSLAGAGRPMGAPPTPLAMKMESIPGTTYGVAGVSPASSGIVSSAGRDTDTAEGELDFDNLWWTAGSAPSATNGGTSMASGPPGHSEPRAGHEDPRSSQGHGTTGGQSAYGPYAVAGIPLNGHALGSGYSQPPSSSLYSAADC